MTINSDLQHHNIQTNGIRLHVVTAGDLTGEPIILLHGFPEFWYGWQHQIDHLADKGFHVIIPDQRGYNLSDKPKGVSAYHINELVNDILGLIEAFDYQQVYLAGHDWGTVVAWWLVTHHPKKLKRLAILNVPYPTVLRQGGIRQLLKSWYIFLFQIPWLPEQLARLNNWHDGRILRNSGHPDTFSDEDILRYKAAWSQEGAITAMINWYRANGRSFLSSNTLPKGTIKVPTLMLWGERDVALRKELAPISIELCENGELVFFPNATHWLQHDEAAVNQHLCNFFGK